MREVDYPHMATEERREQFLQDFFGADHKMAPRDVLEEVDCQLEVHGLEIIITNPGDDNVWFCVTERSKK